MRFYRRNFRRMYPEAGKQTAAAAAAQLRAHFRRSRVVQWVVGLSVAATAAGLWVWLLR